MTALVILFATDVGVLCFAVGRPSQSQSKLSRATTAVVFGPISDRMMPLTALSASAGSAVPAMDPDEGNDTEIYLRGGDIPSSALTRWPCFDALDSRLIKIALPCVLNFAINPLIGAVDLFWVNRMGNALAVAGQSAANQVFNSAFWLASFLPSGECLHPNSVLQCVGLVSCIYF
jgi:hypothetical protein